MRGIAVRIRNIVAMAEQDSGETAQLLDFVYELVDVTRRVDEQVAVAAPDQVGVRAIGGGRVVTAAVYAWRELLREQLRRLRAVTLAAYRRSWTCQHRAPGGDFFFLAGRLAGEHRFALAANDQPGRNVARSSAIDAAAIDVPVAGSRRWIAVSELCHLRAVS